MLDLHYDANANSVIEPSLKALGLTSRYNSFSVGLSQPFHLSTTQTLTLGVVGEVRRSQSLVLGMPFSFVNGAQDGRTNDTVVRLSQDWLEQDSGELLSLHSRVSVGVDAFGATVQGGPGTASGRFVSWLGQALWQRQVFPRAQIVIHGNLQISDGALFPLEQYVFGGIDSLRGYRAYLTSSDDAVNVQSELRCGLFQFAIPGIATTEGDGLVQLVPFVDWGSGWNVRQAAPAYPNLASAGSGVRWSPGSGVVAEIYYGRAFRNVHVGNSLGDQGVQFRVSLKM
jgi:hemolysin activation/secretion protein